VAETEQKNTTNYDSMFAMHERSRDKRRANAAAIASELTRFISPHTVIDVGCGKGHFLAEMQSHGAQISGVDGPWVTEMDADVDIAVLQVQDLEKRYSNTARFDLASSLEVAEHLSPERAETFVQDLCSLSDHILFSAAIPGQKGKGHINCQWQQYWAELFAAQGYDCYDPFRRRLANHDDMAPWFRQNLLFYVKSGVDVSPALAEHRVSPLAASYVLPDNHLRPIKTLQKMRREMLAEIADLREQMPPRTLGADHPHRPAPLAQARGGVPDPLRTLRGMLRQHEMALNAEGIYHFDQVAALSTDNIFWLRAYCAGLTKATPIERWVSDAKEKQTQPAQ
jgi:predicted flap endonuclease-1-like 5' DNA nuclease